MGKINQSKKTKDPYEVGTVLFTAGDSKNDDVWDDSELIEHWEQNVEAYRRMYSNEAKDTQRKTKITKKKPVTRKQSNNQIPSTSSFLPPMPPLPTSQEELSNLIMAWYYCGYYTGLYQAQKQ